MDSILGPMPRLVIGGAFLSIDNRAATYYNVFVAKRIKPKFQVGDLIKRVNEDGYCYLITKYHVIPFFDTKRHVYGLLSITTGSSLTDGVQFIDQFFEKVS